MKQPLGQRRDCGAWVSCPSPKVFASLRLICFPHAGAGPAAYYGWSDLVPNEIEVCVVQLPGRGPRICERPLDDALQVAERLAESLGEKLDRPFAFFGHSMGALLAFEVTRILQDDGRPGPIHLFVSGHRAPHLPRDYSPISDLDDQSLLDEIRRLAGTPAEVLENRELMELLLPALRADFRLCETYTHRFGGRLACPMTALGGLEDRYVNRDGLEAWRSLTCREFAVAMFPGDHFFHLTHSAMVVRAVVRRLVDHLTESPTRPGVIGNPIRPF